MAACESDQAFQKHSAGETRAPLGPAERNNAAATTRRPRTKEVSSRYKSPSPSTPAARRCVSPNFSRTATASSQLVQKRAQSAERKRPSTPPSPPRPSTPVQDSVDVQISSRKAVTGRLGEGLWPSTMRSLSVSFQSDSISIPMTKKEKPASTPSDRTLRPSSNVAHKQVESPVTRKPISERNRSPLKGKNVSDQSENSKPVDALPARLIDQHRWPSRIGGKVSSNAFNRSMDLADKAIRTPASMSGIGLSTVRKMPSDGVPRPLQKSTSDADRLMKQERSNRRESNAVLSDDSSIGLSGSNKLVPASFLDRMMPLLPTVRSQSSPLPVSRQPSPSRMVSPSVSRGVSPSRTRSSTPPRGLSPSRVRPSSPTAQSTSTNSVLSFIVDVRKGKKTAAYIEDAHQLRLLYNRHLQWRFANARAEAVLYNQKVTAKNTLYDVWTSTLDLWDSVIRKRISLQQIKLELKLNSILNGQMESLDVWALLERDHISSLVGAVEDLEASTLRLPVTAGARADTDTLKNAIGSAVDVMQATGISVRPLLSRVEKMNTLISELAIISAHERAMLDDCEALLASIAAMQVQEYSLRTHALQVKQDLENGSSQFWESVVPP
ncbi:AUGMIN subunit 8-like [Punica granatum]|uniref:Uncharacterized protein n=2 Tax=Punica granatum TaxID=22663 RepID=A0A218VZZ2_PUNGR|nr:AUGMIN subunit 8-like [Punica granatum]XP_031388560.1 AUGMIN subunit 8-like [Punica granatum]XP_031388561.1 AUGMIN subunit 8-like [Punica granatum]XP_031388562.1 AUGMIN subunit 8-like [Punica granatum]OWM65839.1 hypothetical protein CDL15_Pgr015264 [Punica granatum]PKI52366.1 hypothetical protein CRG98_027292 [Punica granatum]